MADPGNKKKRKSISVWWRELKIGAGLAYIVTAFHVGVLVGAAIIFYFFCLDCVSANVMKGLQAASNCEASAPVCSEAKQQVIQQAIHDDLACKLGLALLFGAVGGTLIASRAVVYYVRKGDYQPEFFLWQIMTPVLATFLAGVGVFIVRAGLFSLSTSPSVKEPEHTYFVIGFSLLVGIASESFLHRILKTAKTLFGEDREQEKKPDDDKNGTAGNSSPTTGDEDSTATSTGS